MGGTIARATDAAKAERKLSREEELELVKNMSNESAWSHVVSEVMKEKKQAEKDELNMKVKAENKTLSPEIEKTECSQKENLEIVSKKEEIKVEKTLEEEKTSESAGSSEPMMRKISRDIDMSNQKVLETIEFLSSTSSNQDDGTISDKSSDNDVSTKTEIYTNVKKDMETKRSELAESLVSKSMEDAKQIYTVVKKSESQFNDKLTENKTVQEKHESGPMNEQPKEESAAKSSIMAWLNLTTQAKNEEEERSCEDIVDVRNQRDETVQADVNVIEIEKSATKS